MVMTEVCGPDRGLHEHHVAECGGMVVQATGASAPPDDQPVPLVSIIIANHNGGAFIQDALASCLRQTIRNIEVIVIDDASTDDSVVRVRRFARDDDRIRLIRTPTQLGPGGARNHGLAVARGIWLAILDSDDIMHPRRLSQLLEASRVLNVEILADNQLVFDDAKAHPSRPLLEQNDLALDRSITTERYVLSNSLFSRSVPLGYLKPLMLRSFLEEQDCRYDPSLRIAEDYDLILRLLLKGARFHVCPQMTYFYRRHAASTSHRLSTADLSAMLAADEAVRVRLGDVGACPGAGVRQALDRRRRTIERAIDFESLIQTLKARRWGPALALCYRRPGAAALLRIPLRDRVLRLRGAKAPPPDRSRMVRRISLISRQRIMGTTNGSSAYLISLCVALRQAGYEIDLISPSPAMFGRWPFLRLDQSMDVFSSIHVRGAFRVGRFVVAKDPRIAGRAAVGLARRALGRLHPGSGYPDRKAPHAIAVPLTDADRIFIADAASRSTAILADYAFLNEAVPFALQPQAANAVVMHDLFHAQDSQRAVVSLGRADEMALLDLADAVIAIQAEEGQAVKRDLPHKHVILAPMAATPVPGAQAGDDGSLLFVGSNTLPNLDGIRWFLAEVWTRLLAIHPDAQLRVAGACCGSLSDLPPNVTLLGRIDNLEQAYARAGIVISPLRLGSGLKIKLIEAIGHGKAVIATETTLQGVRDVLGHAVIQADTVPEFIEALTPLLHDAAARSRLGDRALAVARDHFSAAACYRDLLAFVHRAEAGRTPCSREPAPVAMGRVPERLSS